MSDAEPRPLVIPPPRADRPPMRANLLQVMQHALTNLVPLFPYTHAGAIVPTGALFVGGPGVDYGQFYHHNSVDEIIIAFVANGATLESGQVYNGGRVHGVNSFLKDQTKAGSFAVFTITQRQLDEGPQPEALTLICSSCRQQVFEGKWDGATPPDANVVEYPVAGAAEPGQLLREYNADPALRTCTKCGHVNDPFPVAAWGWDRFPQQTKTMAAAKQVLREVGARVTH
jgi:hypothetical protein